MLVVDHSVSTNSAVDRQFLKTLIDVREYFHPVTLRKVLFFLFYGAILGGLFSLEFTVGLSEHLIPLVRSNILPLMILLYGFEPVLVLTTLLFTRYPPAPVIADVENTENEETIAANKEMAIVIPAHNSANDISATIHACLKIVRAPQIFVIDNGNSVLPADNTLEVIKHISEDINYHWHTRGNKTVAQYIGALLAKDYSCCLTLDDDVHPPIHFRCDPLLLQSGAQAIYYPIRAIGAENKSSWLIRCQDIEYQQAGYFKMFESRFHGVLYPHGAVSLWERKSWIKMLREHDTRFIAEDVQSGLISERLGSRKKFDSRFYFPTLVPTTLVGQLPNLYQQRARAWSFGIQTLNLPMLQAYVFQWNCMPSDVAVLKLSQTYGLYNNFVDWTRLAVMIISANDPLYWAKLAAVIAGQQVTTIIWHYVKLRNRPDLQQDFNTLISMFVYRWLQAGLTNIGLIRFLAVYLPNLKPAPTIAQLELAGEFKELIPQDERLLSVEQSPPKPSFKHALYSFFKSTAAQTQEPILSPLQSQARSP